MKIHNNKSLASHSTMRLGGNAKFLSEVENKDQIVGAVEWAKLSSSKIMMIGQGSNIIWTDSGFDGLILVNRIQGLEIDEHDKKATVKIGAGMIWDDVVEELVNKGLSGVEQLSLIPGTVGATPVQNVGAYGRELSDVLTSVEAYDVANKKFVTMSKDECDFSYRKSRFNGVDKNRFLIVSITLELARSNPRPPFYASLEKYLKEYSITEYNPKNIRDAVIAIRNSKLPNPKDVANCGSFFANPIVSRGQLRSLQKNYPDIPSWDMGDGNFKISAAWMLDQLGLKGFQDEKTGMALWKNQPLVFVNEKAQNTNDLLEFKQKIAEKVKSKFGIELKQEPELI